MASKLSLVLFSLLVHLGSSFDTMDENNLSERSWNTLLDYYSPVNEEELRWAIRRSRKGKCGKNKLTNWTKNAECKPRPYVIELEKPSDVIRVEPSHVEVMRCEHSKCPKNTAKSCLPKEKRTIKIQALGVKGKKTSCIPLEVEEHVSCECKCLENDCHKPQFFDGNKCSCVCPNKNEEYACNQNLETNWNQQDCTCNTALRSPARPQRRE